MVYPRKCQRCHDKSCRTFRLYLKHRFEVSSGVKKTKWIGVAWYSSKCQYVWLQGRKRRYNSELSRPPTTTGNPILDQELARIRLFA